MSCPVQVRAKTFYAEKKGLNVADVDVPVIGGHAGITILPLFSQASPHAQLSDEETDQLTKRTQDGGTEVVAAKAGKVCLKPFSLSSESMPSVLSSNLMHLLVYAFISLIISSLLRLMSSRWLTWYPSIQCVLK